MPLQTTWVEMRALRLSIRDNSASVVVPHYNQPSRHPTHSNLHATYVVAISAMLMVWQPNIGVTHHLGDYHSITSVFILLVLVYHDYIHYRP